MLCSFTTNWSKSSLQICLIAILALFLYFSLRYPKLDGLIIPTTFIRNKYLFVQNDKLKLLKPGSLQHLGENMLAFLLQAAASSHLPLGKAEEQDGNSSRDAAIYFDILVP